MNTCDRCNGTGETASTELHRGRRVSTWCRCTKCHGAGTLDPPEPPSGAALGILPASGTVTLRVQFAVQGERYIFVPASMAVGALMYWSRNPDVLLVDWTALGEDRAAVRGEVPGPAYGPVRTQITLIEGGNGLERAA